MSFDAVKSKLEAMIEVRPDIAPIAKLVLSLVDSSQEQITKSEETRLAAEEERDELADQLRLAEKRVEQIQKSAAAAEEAAVAERIKILHESREAIAKAREADRVAIQKRATETAEAEVFGEAVAKAVAAHPDIQAALFLKKCVRSVHDGRDFIAAKKSFGPWECMTPTGTIIVETRADAIEVARNVVKFLAEKDSHLDDVRARKPKGFPEPGGDMGFNDTYDRKRKTKR